MALSVFCHFDNNSHLYPHYKETNSCKTPFVFRKMFYLFLSEIIHPGFGFDQIY